MRTLKSIFPVFLGILFTLGMIWGMAYASSEVASENIIYVDTGASGTATGLNWTDAYTNLQDALTTAISGTQIWVAEGVYYPDEGFGQINDAPTSTFELIDGVALYGGFSGIETTLDERDWEAHVTVLSGDLGQDDNADPTGIVTTTGNITGTNSYHVVYSYNLDETAALDGFTITAGQADGSSTSNRGGGIYNYSSSPALNNLILSGNWGNNGGGIFNEYYSNPILMNVTFSNNSAGNGGGGLYNHTNSNATLTNVVFSGNSVSNFGGGIYNHSSNPTLINLMFTGNRAGFFGGGLYNNSTSNPSLKNVTFSGNSANTGGGIYNTDNSDPTLTNAILWGNSATNEGDQIYNNSSTPVISYTLIQSSTIGGNWDTSLGIDGGNNIDADPLFVRNPNPGDGDWSTLEDNDYGDLRLRWGSPAIDAGTNTGCPVTDLDGNPRPIGLFCDMGAYESLVKIFLPLLIKNP